MNRQCCTFGFDQITTDYRMTMSDNISTKGIIWCTYFVHKKDYVWYIGRQNRSYYELNFSYRRVYTFSYSSTFLTIDTSVTGDLNFLCDWIWCLVFLARAGIIQLDGLKMSCKIDSAFLHKLYHMYICRCLTQSLSCSSRIAFRLIGFMLLDLNLLDLFNCGFIMQCNMFLVGTYLFQCIKLITNRY
jgi:hypothetical protein